MAIIDKPTDYFNTILWTGNGVDDRSISGVGFQPDWVWYKERSSTSAHKLYDAVRTATKELESNSNAAESTNADALQAFETDGFQVGTHGSVNQNGETYVAWNWKAGTSVSGNTGGSGTAKTYTGSVNTTSGFSIINFVGNGTAGHTIPHHLGVAPKMVIVKNRTSGSTSWQTYHYNLDNGAGTNEIFLDGTGATNGSAGAWNNTAPSSTVITKGTGSYGNENNSNHIMYSFAEKQGYSKFGSYVGSGSAPGTFSYLGFKPAFLLMKESDGADGWGLYDNKRNPSNTTSFLLQANSSGAESNAVANTIDFLSNGFKVCASGTQGNFINESGKTYIYMAFAENPFVTSTGVPATAR